MDKSRNCTNNKINNKKENYMKTKIIRIDYCKNKKCTFNINGECITNPEIDNHNNCLSCNNKINFKIQ